VLNLPPPSTLHRTWKPTGGVVPGGGIGNGTAYWSLDTAPYPAGEIAGFFPPSVFLSRWRGERAEGAEVGVEGGGKRLVFFWIVVEEGGTGHRGGKIGRPKFAWKNPYKESYPRSEFRAESKSNLAHLLRIIPF